MKKIFFLTFLLLLNCWVSSDSVLSQTNPTNSEKKIKVVHVFVALCDKDNQGIISSNPVLENGDDLKNNQYWGALYGVKTFFSKDKDWKMVFQTNSLVNTSILERCVFKHNTENVFMVADAYRGKNIKNSISDFLNASAEKTAEEIKFQFNEKETSLNIAGGADLVVYIGHDGLMDFQLDTYPEGPENSQKEVIIFACKSKKFFGDPIRKTGAYPLLWTTGLMAPEAYILKSALDGWILNENGDLIKKRVAETYKKFQRLSSLKPAMRLFATGW